MDYTFFGDVEEYWTMYVLDLEFVQDFFLVLGGGSTAPLN